MAVEFYKNANLGRCPVCGVEHTGHAANEKDDSLRLPPQPDDIIVCAYCAEVLKVTPGRTLRLMTAAEKLALPEELARELRHMVLWSLIHMPRDRKEN